MKPGIWARIDVFIRNLGPVTLCFLLIILNLIPFYLPDYAGVKPMLVLCGVYYWTIYRPDLLPYWTIFVLGLLMDLLYGGAPGVNAFTLLVAAMMVSLQRNFFSGTSFAVVWWGYMLSAALVAILNISLQSLLLGGFVPPMPVFFSYLISIALYPILHMVFVKVQTALPLPDEME